MKEFNLSKKRKELRENCNGFRINSIMDLVEQQDKEFIKRLKEEIKSNIAGSEKFYDDNPEHLLKFIDKLAGKELVEAKGK